MLTREDLAVLQRMVDVAAAVSSGQTFTIEGIDAKFRAALVPEQTLIDYQDLGKRFGIEPGVLPAILLAIGGCVLAEAVNLHEKKAVEVPDGAPLN